MLSLRIISWNLHGPPLAPRRSERFAAVAEHILCMSPPPDVLCLQELWFRGEAAQLVGRLKGVYDAVEAPGARFPGTRGGLLTLVRRASGWTIRQHQFTRYRCCAPAWRVWEGDGYANKGIYRVDLERDAQPLVIFNTHLQAQYPRRTYDVVRRIQVEQFNQTAAVIAPTTPVLACGDFNTTPDDAIYGALAESWIDLTKETRLSEERATTIVAPNGTPEWIDYVLLQTPSQWTTRTVQLARLESHAADVPFSDHHGLDLQLQIERSNLRQDRGSGELNE